MRERGGALRLIHSKEQPNQGSVYNTLAENVSRDVEMIVTDDSRLYGMELTQFRGKHESVNHSAGEYVRRSLKGPIHTNTVENAFSLLKRGIVGSFHQISTKHLHRYLDEFSYRFNRRKQPDIFEQTVGNLVAAEPLQYRQLVAEN